MQTLSGAGGGCGSVSPAPLAVLDADDTPQAKVLRFPCCACVADGVPAHGDVASRAERDGPTAGARTDDAGTVKAGFSHHRELDGALVKFFACAVFALMRGMSRAGYVEAPRKAYHEAGINGARVAGYPAQVRSGMEVFAAKRKFLCIGMISKCIHTRKFSGAWCSSARCRRAVMKLLPRDEWWWGALSCAVVGNVPLRRGILEVETPEQQASCVRTPVPTGCRDTHWRAQCRERSFVL